MQEEAPTRPDAPTRSSRAGIVALAAALCWFPVFITGDHWKYLVPFADAVWAVGIFALPIVAVVAGRKARRQLNATADPGNARRIATIGMVLGWIELGTLVAVTLFGIIWGIVYFVRVARSG